MAARATYRSFYATFWDDPDLQSLSHLAYRVLTTLKGTLPAPGIGHVYDDVLAHRCGCTEAELAEAFAELQEPKHDGSRGWIMRERDIVWVVNGLKFEPTIRHTDAKHCAFVAECLSQFGGASSPLSIVRAFRAHYAKWFAPEKDPPKAPDEDPKQGSAKDPSKGSGEALDNTRTKTKPNKPTAARARASAAAVVVDEQKREAPDGDRSDADHDRMTYATRCVVALNLGMRANRHVTAFMELVASNQAHTVTWFEDGIDIETVESAIAKGCAAFRPTPTSRQISSLRYFDARVREVHDSLVRSGDVERSRERNRANPALRSTPERTAWLRKQGFAV